MAYATIDDLYEAVPEAKIVPLVDDEGDGLQVGARIDAALDRATDEIDARLEGIYDLPLDPVPDRARALCVDMAIFHLFSRVQEEISPTRKLKYENALAFLEDVRDGKTALVKADGQEAEPSPSAGLRLYAI